ncbi:MAG: T9SS type A sorting domain-containing protein, partial [Bacteroidota bacterium]
TLPNAREQLNNNHDVMLRISDQDPNGRASSAMESEYTIYSVPNDGRFTVSFMDKEKPGYDRSQMCKLSVVEGTTGQIVYEQDYPYLSLGELTLDLRGILSSGLYVVRITTTTGSHSKKVIVDQDQKR